MTNVIQNYFENVSKLEQLYDRMKRYKIKTKSYPKNLKQILRFGLRILLYKGPQNVARNIVFIVMEEKSSVFNNPTNAFEIKSKITWNCKSVINVIYWPKCKKIQ